MKILMVASAYPPDIRGGGEISTRILAESLSKLGAEVTVLAAAAEDREDFANGVRIKRVASPNQPWNFEKNRGALAKLFWHIRENYNPGARRIVAKTIAETAPDIVVTSTIENFGKEAWAAAKAAKVGCVHILRSYFVLCWRGTAFRDGKNCDGNCADCRVFSYGRRQASSDVTAVIGITKHILDFHLERGTFPAAKGEVINNVLPDPIDRSQPQMTRGEAVAGTIFGFLGVLSPNKGLELLGETWRQVQGEGRTLRIGGDGDPAYVGRLRAAMPKSAAFLGWVEADAFLDSLDFLIVPSIWREPFGRIIVEAFARGVPVIGSARGGIPELIDPGRTGFLFDPGKPDSLRQAIAAAESVSREDYAVMRRACLEESGKYSQLTIARRYLDFFSTLGETAPA